MEYNEFDLDLRNNSDDGSYDTYKFDKTIKCVIKTCVKCPSKISEAVKCTPKCPVPTLGEGQKPVASCHKMGKGAVQPRC